MKLTPLQLGEAIHAARKNLGVTQKALALTSGTGLRFIVDLEKGKPTCQIGKALTVLNTLGASVKLITPSVVPGADAKPLAQLAKPVVTRDLLAKSPMRNVKRRSGGLQGDDAKGRKSAGA